MLQQAADSFICLVTKCFTSFIPHWVGLTVSYPKAKWNKCSLHLADMGIALIIVNPRSKNAKVWEVKRERKTTNSLTTMFYENLNIRQCANKTNTWLKSICCAQGNRRVEQSIHCYCATEVNTALWSASQLIFRGLWEEKIFIKTTTKLVFQFGCGSTTSNSQEIQSFICHNGSSGSYSLENKIQLPVMGLLEAE